MESGVIGSPIVGSRDRRPSALSNLTPIHSAAGSAALKTTATTKVGGAPGGSPTKHGEHDKQKQGHVMRELLETERTYVSELKAILEVMMIMMMMMLMMVMMVVVAAVMKTLGIFDPRMM